MEILAHRGLWYETREKNSEKALVLAVKNGFGIETDVRDLHRTIEVSHDPPMQKLLTLNSIIDSLIKIGNHSYLSTIALNIKSDGIEKLLKQVIDNYSFKKYFCFDMSTPQLMAYQSLGLKTFTRHSDVEPIPVFYDRASGVWLDELISTWLENTSVIESHFKKNKQVCVVSPELHGRTYEKVWDILHPIRYDEKLMLCTDYPDKAREFFK